MDELVDQMLTKQNWTDSEDAQDGPVVFVACNEGNRTRKDPCDANTENMACASLRYWIMEGLVGVYVSSGLEVAVYLSQDFKPKGTSLPCQPHPVLCWGRVQRIRKPLKFNSPSPFYSSLLSHPVSMLFH